ncbi:MAG: RNA polymerase sigma factor [Kofleriaceae bacterium]
MHETRDVAELYRRHAPALHRRCASIVGNADEARDLVQETFARYLAALDNNRFADATPFAVLYRIATNASIDRLRRRKTASEDALEPNAQATTLGGQSGDPNTTARRVDALHDLVHLTKGLSEEEVMVAVLHHIDGYTQDGIAESLDLSRRTVGKILAKFEDHLKKRAARFSQKVAADG